MCSQDLIVTTKHPSMCPISVTVYPHQGPGVLERNHGRFDQQCLGLGRAARGVSICDEHKRCKNKMFND